MTVRARLYAFFIVFVGLIAVSALGIYFYVNSVPDVPGEPNVALISIFESGDVDIRKMELIVDGTNPASESVQVILSMYHLGSTGEWALFLDSDGLPTGPNVSTGGALATPRVGLCGDKADGFVSRCDPCDQSARDLQVHADVTLTTPREGNYLGTLITGEPAAICPAGGNNDPGYAVAIITLPLATSPIAETSAQFLVKPPKLFYPMAPIAFDPEAALSSNDSSFDLKDLAESAPAVTSVNVRHNRTDHLAEAQPEYPKSPSDWTWVQELNDSMPSSDVGQRDASRSQPTTLEVSALATRPSVEAQNQQYQFFAAALLGLAGGLAVWWADLALQFVEARNTRDH